jgi:mannose-6-phosphate isomerase-like protein (cupin superfamily)
VNSPEFIFMLTRADRTVPDAMDRLGEVLAAGVRHIGFKDVGAPLAELHRLARAIRAAGATLYLEVVSLDAASEAASAKAAVDLGVDYLLGGCRPDVVLPVISERPIRYFPFAGGISGHPSVLEGTVEEIAESARRLCALEGVHGVDLLAYRFAGDASALIRAVCARAGKPVIVAGSIDRPARVAAALHGGAAAFTVGTAALDGVFPASGPTIAEQIEAIRAAQVSALATSKNGAGTSPMQKVNLTEAFAAFTDHWSPKIAGDIGTFQLKLVKLKGPFHWHHHDQEDELFLVVSGRLRMGFRDQAVDLDPGEFIIVPHGVEHLPEALTEECHVLLLEPNTTLNTGNVENERTVRNLARLPLH